METTTEYVLETTVASLLRQDDNDDDSVSNQITFEIPSNVDLERIKNLDNFTNLLHRILPATPFGGASVADGSAVAAIDSSAGYITSDGQIINNDQISGSVVLNLADLKSSGSGLESLFGNTDIHTIINYLWIGIVTSLIILSVIFIIFSCYFYRKFKEWKKCNKDIRSQLSNDMYPQSCPSGNPSESDYYQMESPPCYTIATGLPTYDEALQQTHFTIERKVLEPSFLAGVNVLYQSECIVKTPSAAGWIDGGNLFYAPNAVVPAYDCSNKDLHHHRAVRNDDAGVDDNDCVGVVVVS